MSAVPAPSRLPMIRALLVLLSLAASSVSAAAQAAAEPMLHPGDRVTLTVYRNQELSGTFPVAPDSSLLHPVFRHVKVAGVPVPVAEARLREAMRRFDAEPMFAFAPEYRVFVGGMVRDPNQFHLPDMTVAQAISRAGGSTAPDRRFRLRFVRDGRQTVVSFTDPAVTEILLQPIRSGDQIVVEERPSFTRSYLDPSLRILQAVGSVLSAYVIINQILGNGD